MIPPTSQSLPRRSRRLARWAATGAVLLVGLSGCAGNAATLGEAIPAVGGAPRAEPVITPEVGQCRKLTDDGIHGTNDNTPASDCSATHTTLTYVVGKLDDKVKTVDDVKDVCAKGYDKALGLTQDKAVLTVFSWAYFMPTAREYALGHRDYRCDLVATNTYTGTPQALPGSKIPLIAGGKYAESYALCNTTNDHQVSCSQAHVWKAVYGFLGPVKWPGEAAVKRLAKAKCSKAVHTKHYSYTWVGEDWWTDDNRAIICWDQTKKS
jgi:hypothetical protein